MHMFNKNVRRTVSIFVLLTLCVGLCLEAAALEEMAVGELHELDGGYSIKVEGADIEHGVALFVLVNEEGRGVDEITVSRGEGFSLTDNNFFFEAALDSVFRSDDTIMVHLVDYGWEWREPEPEIPTAPPTPMTTPPHYDDEPDFLLFYLIIALVFSLAIGLPLFFVIYRKGKPPSGEQSQKKPQEPEEKKLAKMNCPYCGAEVREEDKFCGECGKPL